MKPGLLAGIVAAAMVASGAAAIFGPSALSPPFGTSHDSSSPLDCENLVEGDRIEIRDDTTDGRREIRVEADTRVRAEARFERADGSDSRREARIEICGIVEFIDRDGDGRLGSADSVVRSSLVRFGVIQHVAGPIHLFTADSGEANMTVTIRIPDVMPTSDAPLVQWAIRADPQCEGNATHFAVKVERDVPSGPDEFGASPCGTPLDFSGDERTSTPAPSPPGGFACRQEITGTEFSFSLIERSGEGSKRWEGRVEADTRIRAEVRLDNGTSSDDGGREARISLCGIFQLVDRDGDGQLGTEDATLTSMLLPFGPLVHAVDGGFHVFRAEGETGNFSVTIRAPATFPLDEGPLLAWEVIANPTCEPNATHFAVLLEQDIPEVADRLLVGECGRILSVTDIIG